jgi:ABC-type multidrug transport system permease subunit
MNQPPIPAPTPEQNPPDMSTARHMSTARQSPIIKYGRMFLLIVLWCGVAVFGSTAILGVFNAYAVAIGFPTNITPRFLLTMATTNALATALCILFIRMLRIEKRG